MNKIVHNSNARNVYPVATVDHMLCFALYSASRASMQAYRRLLEPWGLTYLQFLVLVELWERGEVSVKELGDDLSLDSGTLSPVLKRMEGAGLVARERRDRDGRVLIITPTPQGEALRAEMGEVAEALIRCAGMPVTELVDLVERLHVLTDRLTTATSTITEG